MAHRALTLTLMTNMDYSGPFRIIEQITRFGFPASREVRLHYQRNGVLVRTRVSGSDGYVLFDCIKEGPWIVCSLDHEKILQSVMIDQRMATLSGYRE